MDIIERLDNLRRDFPACSLAAFADLSTGMVLCASTQFPGPQERLDRLCGTAREMLTGASAHRVSAMIGQGGSARFHYAIAVEQSELALFLRSETEAADALCCVVNSQVDLERFYGSARKHLETISAGT